MTIANPVTNESSVQQIHPDSFQTANYVAGYEEMILSPVPESFELHQNYPNPFNPSTTIPFSVPAIGAGMVPASVEIFNAIGQRVKVLLHESVQPGYHRAVWAGDDASGRQVGSGIYFYRVQVGEAMRVGRMALVK